MPTDEPVAYRELFQNDAYRWFVIGITTTNVGQFLAGLANPFLVKDLTDSNAWVGAVGFAGLIPALIVTPLAGTMADRIDRRTILLCAYSAQCIITLALLGTYASGNISANWLLLFAFLGGTAAGFQWAPIQSMAAVLVPREQLIPAVRLVSISFTAGRAIGPALAGLTLHFFGPGEAFAGTFLTYALGLAFLSRVRTDLEPPIDAGESFLTQFRAGLRYVNSEPSLRNGMFIAFLVAGTGAVWIFSLVASIADDILDVGGGGLGALSTAAGIGSVLGSLIIAGRGGRVARSKMESATLLAYAVGLVAIALAGNLLAGLIGFLIAGGAHMLHGVTMNTAMQVQVQEEFRGRVMAVWMSSILAGLPIGALIGGALADAFDIRVVIVGYAALLASVLGVLVWRTDRLAFLDQDQL